VNRRRWLGWLAAFVLAALFGGWLPGLTVALLAGYDGWRGLRPRPVLVSALVVLLALPFGWLFGNVGRLGRPTFDLVSKVPIVGLGGALALTLLCVGVGLDVLSPDRSGEGDDR
jgi:hypothetical protein